MRSIFENSAAWCPPFRVSPPPEPNQSASFSGPLYRAFLRCTAKPDFFFAAKSASVFFLFVPLRLCVRLPPNVDFPLATTCIHDFHVSKSFRSRFSRQNFSARAFVTNFVFACGSRRNVNFHAAST